MRVTKKEWLRSGIVLVMLAGTMGITVPVMAETTVLTEDTTQGRLACESGTDKQNPKIIDMNGYNLSIRGEENNGILNSIHIGNNQYLSVKNSTADKKLSISAENSNTPAANGIKLEGNSLLHITGAVEITKAQTAGDAAAGIAFQGKDSEAVIDGTLKITDVYGKRERGAGMNAAGIVVTGDKSKIKVTGAVDISGVRGSGLKTVGADTEISVGGGTITAVEDTDKSRNYQAVRVQKGTININMDGSHPGSMATKITGDMYATGQYGQRVVEYSGGQLVDWKDAGILNVALTDKDSFWKGAAVYDNYTSDYGSGGKTVYDVGQVNLYLQNGAQWINEKQSHGTTTTVNSAAWTGSILANLYGGSDTVHRGYIYQKDSTPISVLNYTGHTLVYYDHDGDGTAAENFSAGDFRIKSASEGSSITLRTNSANTSDEAALGKILGVLANKLYYMGYTEGDTKLKGTVEIAEGLTASSASMDGNIAFRTDTDTEKNGQGTYTYVPAIVEILDGPIVKDRVLTADSKVVVNDRHAVGGYFKSVMAAYNGDDSITVDMMKHSLRLEASSDKNAAYVIGTKAGIGEDLNNINFVNMEKNKPLVISVTNNSGKATQGIILDRNSRVLIDGDAVIEKVASKGITAIGIYNSGANSELTINGSLKMSGSGDTEWNTIEAKEDKIKQNTSAILNQGGKITISGPVDIKVKGTAINSGYGNGMIRIAGGRIMTPEMEGEMQYRLFKTDSGTIYINMNESGTASGSQDTILRGDGDFSGATVRIGLASENSSWSGVAYSGNGRGNLGVYISNDAVWHNKRTTRISGSSHLMTLKGGNDAAHAGVIYQKDDKSITIDNYSGHTVLVYDHAADTPKMMIGGDTIITKAEHGSFIRMVTDNGGLDTNSEKAADKNLVSETLNALANKLFYKGYTDAAAKDNLKGTVEIAEGLTASSASVALRKENMSFRDSTGQGEYKYTPENDIPEHQTVTEFSTTLDGIEATDVEYTEGGVRRIVDGKVLYNFTENSTITVDDGDYAGSDAFSNPAILGSKNTTIDINVAEGKVLKLVADSAGGHWADGITALDGSKTTINGDIEIHAAESGNGSGTGIRMTPAGTSQGAKTDVIINGNLKIRKDDPNAPWAIGNGVYASYGARYQATGLFNNQSGNSLLKVSGDVDLAVKGTAVAVDDYYDGDAVIDLAGGRIETPDDREKKENTYLSLASYSGTINLNYDAEKQSSRGRKVELIGNTLVIDAKNHQQYNWLDGKMNLALDTADSYWNGAATNAGADKLGVFNLVLKNGAVWDNQLWAKAWDVKDPYIGGKFDGISHVTKFSGGDSGETAGVIKMRPGVGLSVEEYAGNTTVIYEHDTAEPADPNEGFAVKGGDFKIAKAASDSGIVLRTDNTGLNTSSTKAADRNLVSGTLNKLANKLYYTAYKDGEKNLTGKVEIAEGLTASATGLRIEDITYKETDGQGFYAYTPASDTLTEFGRAITGGTDQLYVDAGVKQADGTYKFTKDSTITIEDTVLGETYPVNTDGGDKVIIDAEGKRLTLISKGAGLRAGIQTVLKNNKKIDITADKLIINAENTTGMSRAYGIWFAGNSSTLDIHGDTEITSKANDWSYGVLLGRASKANFDGLKISVSKEAKESAALKGTGKSVLSVNMQGDTAGSRSVQLDGEVVTKYSFEEDYEGTQQTDGPSTINLALTTANSYWNGLSAYSYKDENDGDTITKEDHGNLNLWLQNGAVWTNEKYGKTEYAGFKGSYATRLTGGSDVSHAGVIIQKDEKPISVENYSGHTTVIYEHDTAAPADPNEGFAMKGGDFKIAKAAANSGITFRTDNEGLNTASNKAADKNLVSGTLNKLANKLHYEAYTKGEKNLTGKVEIAEGLTAQSASMRMEDITYRDADGRGQYLYTPAVDIPEEQDVTEFSTAITGDETADTFYVNHGVLKNGLYSFTKSESTITTDGASIPGGPWMGSIMAAISGSSKEKSATLDLNGNKLTVDTDYNATVGIAGIGSGKVEINNAGAMSVNGQRAALYANGGGTITIHNGHDSAGTLTLRAGGSNPSSVAVVKTMNGADGVTSSITIDGLVDILADAKAEDGHGANEAVSAVASDINIGGGTIKAINGAWAAIRAYGEFVSQNYGTVNVNVTKGEDGLANGAGSLKTVIEGDIVTNGGMGTKGRVSVGLSTADSHWIGNYGDTRGYGVTQGQLGAVNLFMKNGSYWKGFSNGSIKVEMDGKNTNWVGFNVGDGMQLSLKNGATWYNAITKDQKDQSGKSVDSKVAYFTSNKGVVDMTGAKAFIASANSLSGPTSGQSTFITEAPDSETGNLVIGNYSGNTTVIYKHEIKDDEERENAALYGNKAANIIGGDLIITKAAEKSSITLRTDNDGLNPGSGVYTDRNLVSDTLDKLANKLYYTAYKEGERNLTGIVEIAEGLTSSAVSRKTGGVAYKEDGQGEYTYKLVEKPADSQSVTEYGKAILGSNDRDTMYIDTGVLKDGVYHFTKSETTIAIDGTVDKAEGKRDLVEFGPWFRYLDAAISGSVPQYDEEGNKITYDPTTVVSNSVKMDLHGNKLNINAKYDQGAGQTGIAAIAAMNRVETAGKVEINNAGAMNVNVKGSGMTAALFADGGGKLVIHNGGENQEEKILTLRGGSLYKNSGVGIKTMNGNIKAESGVNKHSEITIDGLVDVVADGKASADGYSSNEAVSAVASDINIGGGTIKAINGAWAAIRAYGEFTTPNYGIVNVNAANRTYVNEDGTAMGGTVKVHKVSDFDIGENRAVIEGDIVTNGGMGTKGQVNIGLKDKDSHWIGNYADTVGYGVTQGSFGAVNIKMKDGAFWKGFGNGSMNIEMTGKRTYWHGFSIVEKMQLSLKDGSTWYNAITPEQTNQSGKAAHAKIGWLTSDNGVIDMVGRNVFVATSTSLNGQTTAENPSGIVESENGVTGNVEIKNYSGNTAVIYKHEIKDDEERENAALYGNKAANIIGGTLTVAKAAANSFITLRTDNEGLNTASEKAADKNLVSETLNKLANKLFYTAYKDGERNLTGKVEIAEGLTASAAGLRIGDITYKDADGQGRYLYTPETPESQTIQDYEEGITGNETKDQVYVNTGVLKNGIYTFGLTPTTITAEKPIAAETDITIQGGSIKMELKNSGENKTALETGSNTVTITAGHLDMKEGDAEIKGGTLNAYTDIKGREIKVENGGKLHMAGNLDIDTLSVNGENAKALLLADKEGVPTITAKANTIIVTDKALLNISKGAKAETGLLSVNNASANFNDTVTIGSSLEAENGARVMMRNGGAIKGTVKAENEGTLVSLTGASLKENSTIEAWDKAQINLTRGSTEGNKVKAAGGTVKLRQGSYKLGDIEATNKGTAYIEGENGTSITGRLKSEGKGSTITAVLKGENSILEGNLEGSGKINLELKEKARWKGTGTVTGKMKTTLREGSLWTNKGKSDIGWLTSENGNIDMRESGEGYVRITNYKGKTNFLYGQDGTGNIEGGDITIRKAEEGSRVNLITDNRGLNTSETAGTEEKALVTKTLDNMARKLNYIGYQKGERNLEGSVTIAEGLTASSAVMKTGEISYSERGNGRYIEKGEKKETGRTSLGSLGMTRNAIYTLEPAKAEPVTATKTAETAAGTSTEPRMMKVGTVKGRNSEIIYGDKETQMMKGSKTAMTAAALLWRGNNNDLERRMGDIRLGKEENGIWARYLGGKNELDKQKTSYKQTYNIAQAGYDKKKGNWTIGMALDYGTGKDTYANGTGKEKLGSLSLYGTMQKEDGQYIDIILKGSRIKNDYTVYNEMNHRLEGKYKTSGVSVSMEYGKRMQKENGIYIEPSIELTAGHLRGKDYDAVSDYAGGKKMHIHQEGINSVIGRIGLGIGKETERTSLFAKIGLSHEFGGKVKSTFSAEGEPTSGTEVELKDSWVDVEVGGSLLVNRNTYLYGTYTRNFGADVSSKWRIDAGIRFSF